MIRFTLYLFIVLLPIEGNCRKFFDAHELGWFWYKESKKEEKKEKKESLPKIPYSYTQKNENFKKELDESLNKAIYNPTPENILEYRKIQNIAMERADIFQKQFLLANLSNPEILQKIERPTNNISRTIFWDESKKKLDLDFKKFTEKFNLVFFYSSQCPYCHKYADILNNLAKKYNLKIKGISADETIESMPESIIDRGISQKFNVRYYPTLIAVDPNSGRYFTISESLLSLSEIEDKVQIIIDSMENKNG